MISGIYLIKNIANNKIYIGSAINIHRRWKEHKLQLKEGKHHSYHLQSAWNTYGEQSFKFEILEEVSNPQHLLAYEQVYLDYYKSYEKEKGYNICKVAGSHYGLKRSEETKQKMSEAKQNMSEETKRKIGEASKGRKHNEQSKQKMREAKKKIRETLNGRKQTEETKQKLREINKGKTFSKETRKKISEANKGHIVSEETRKKLSEAGKNRIFTEEHKKKISEAKKAKKIVQN